MPPHPLPLPAGERGRVRGKFQIYLARIHPMVTLCIVDANGGNEQLIDKKCGWASVNEISEKVQKSLITPIMKRLRRLET